MNYDILINILLSLIVKRKVTAKELSEKYEVSTRSIYRYLNKLSTANIPILSVRGAKGCFYIPDSYKLPYNIFTESELKTVIDALNSFKAQIPTAELDSAIRKISSTKDLSGDNNISGNVVIDAAPWGDAISYKNKLKLISSAIENLHCLKIEYHDRLGEITTRIIEPHTLVFKQGIWYVYAFCQLRKDFRFFKIGRIFYAHANGETFVRQVIDNLPFQNWYQEENLLDCKFLVEKQSLSEVEEWLGVENFYVYKEQNFVEVKLPFDNGLVSKILSFGGGITVIEPKILVDKIRENCKLILKNY